MDCEIKMLLITTSLEKILKESGALALTRALANSKTENDKQLSRRLGIAYIRCLADLIKYDEPVCTSLLLHFSEIYESYVMKKSQLVSVLQEWRKLKETCESKINLPEYSYEYFALCSAADWLCPCDWDVEEELNDAEIEEYASGTACRVLQCFLETYIRLQPSVLIARKVAESAIQEERKWRIGTKTEFRLVEDAVINVIDEHVNHLSAADNTKKMFNELIMPVTQICIEKQND